MAAYMWMPFLNEGLLRGQASTILLGVVSSVIATLLISISGKYSVSCRAHVNIVYYAAEMIRWVQRYKDYFCTNHKEWTKHGFYLNQYYMDMCNEARQLTYDGDFSKFSKSIAFFMENLNENLTTDEFEMVIEDFNMNVSMYDRGHIQQNKD